MSQKAEKSGVFAARKKLHEIVPATPLVPVKWRDATLWCKCESDQPVGAFKLRGAWHRLTALTDAEKRAGVVAFSSGNHAQGVAWAAKRLGIAASIVMPADAPRLKIEGTRQLGADVILYDRKAESREAIASTLAAERGAVLVPSFDDKWIIEGQGSAGIEALEQHPSGFGLIVTPCGGGGLASGLALAMPETPLVLVEPEGWDDMGQSLRAGDIIPVSDDPPETLCDALMTMRVAPSTFDILSRRGVRGVAVSEDEVKAAIRFAASELGRIIEPGGAAGLAALLAGRIDPAPDTLVILSGGNIDPGLHRAILRG